MNEQDFARRVTRHLDAGLDDLPPSVVYRLRAARDVALAHTQEHQGTPGSADVSGLRSTIARHRLLVPLAVVFLLAVGMLFWQQQTPHVGPARYADFADVDTEMLTDDLPVVAYLDPGFEIWLYHHSPATAEE